VILLAQQTSIIDCPVGEARVDLGSVALMQQPLGATLDFSRPGTFALFSM